MKAYAALLLLVHLAACSGEPAKRDHSETGNGSAAGAANAMVSNEAADVGIEDPDTKLVVVFGDSLYAGYNLGPAEGFAPVLQRALAKDGVKARVVNAGVSGETTSDGLRRLAFTLDGLPRKPDLVFVGFGGNDMLRGLDPGLARRNLDAIMAELQRRGIEAILTGMLASRNMGPDYARSFDSIYPDLAKKYGVPLYPFFLDGVIQDRALLLADGLHPNARGIVTIVGRVAPLAVAELKD